MIASDVTLRAAQKLNDPSQATYTNTIVLPFLQMANEELQDLMEINGLPLQKQKSITINVDAAATELPSYPSDFLEPITLWERARGVTDNFTKVEEKEWEPEQTSTAELIYWCWRNNKVELLPPTSDREAKLYYWRSITPLTTAGATVEIAQAANFLAARTAQLVASDVANSPSRADALEVDVQRALDRFLRRGVKLRQNLGVRRRGYKGRSGRVVFVRS